MGEQAENIERVDARIGWAVVDFCRHHIGQQFFAEDLHLAVKRDVGDFVAPASADRILRLKRQDGTIDYEVVSRSESLYEVIGLIGEDEDDMADLVASQRAAAVIIEHPILQTKNVPGAGSYILCEQLSQKLGLSITIIRHAGVVYRRSPKVLFPKVQNGEMTVEQAYRKSLNGYEDDEPLEQPARPPNQKQRAKNRLTHAQIVELGCHLTGFVMALKGLDLVGAWRHGSLDAVVSSLRRSRRQLADWEKELLKAKKEAAS